MSANHTMGEEDARVLFELSRLKDDKAKKATADGTYRSALSRLESKGIHLRAAKEALKIADKGELSETLEYLAALTRYLKLLGLPIKADQKDLFEVAPALQPVDEMAHEQGAGAGVIGSPQTDNPHDPSTKAGQAWLAGWHEGAAMRAAFAKAVDDEASETDEDENEFGGFDTAA
jgi:ribosome modulation factor